jgi:hypothetical protein
MQPTGSLLERPNTLATHKGWVDNRRRPPLPKTDRLMFWSAAVIFKAANRSKLPKL